MVTYQEVRANEDIKTYIKMADETMASMRFTEHSFAHVVRCADVAGGILEKLGYDERTVELAQIAAYMHDIGNVVNRAEHAQSGAIMAFRLLDKMNMDADDLSVVVSAIGNHDEGTGFPIDAVSAALILADKSDVRRSRVRNTDISSFDIHDRVNYSVENSKLDIEKENNNIRLTLEIDTKYSAIMDYFEIFLDRMILCRKAAEKLGMNFKLNINGQGLL